MRSASPTSTKLPKLLASERATKGQLAFTRSLLYQSGNTVRNPELLESCNHAPPEIELLTFLSHPKRDTRDDAKLL